MSTEAPRRGRPRSETARKATLEAATELLLSRGLAAASMDAVAERAGVSKATIYRWWRTKETLALDALYHEWAAVNPPARSGGSLRADLLASLGPWARLLSARPHGGVIASMIAAAQTDPAFGEEWRARFIGPRRKDARAIFRRAIERGELAPDTNVELALDLLYGPVYHRLLQGHAPVDEGFVRDVIDAVLGGLFPAPARRSPSSSAHGLERELRPLALDEVLGLRRQGAQILDTRNPCDFEDAHLAGAVNVGLDGSYAIWCGMVLDRERPIVLVADPGREQEAAARLGGLGFGSVEGFLEGGVRALDSHPDRVAHVERVTAEALAEQLASRKPPLVLDVRTEREWRENRIGTSINLPLIRIARRLERLPSDRPLVVHCGTGYRSAIAASLLLRNGAGAVADLAGGLAAWQSSDLETVGTEAS